MRGRRAGFGLQKQELTPEETEDTEENPHSNLAKERRD